MDKLVIANILAIIASILLVWSGYIKSKDNTIRVRVVQILFCITYCFLAGNFGGIVGNVISLTRNVLYLNNKLTKKIAIVLCTAAAIPILIADISIFGKLPLISVVLSMYNMFTDREDIKKYKTIAFIGIFFWTLNDFYYKLYTSFISDICFMFTNMLRVIITIIEEKKEKMKGN